MNKQMKYQSIGSVVYFEINGIIVYEQVGSIFSVGPSMMYGATANSLGFKSLLINFSWGENDLPDELSKIEINNISEVNKATALIKELNKKNTQLQSFVDFIGDLGFFGRVLFLIGGMDNKVNAGVNDGI